MNAFEDLVMIFLMKLWEIDSCVYVEFSAFHDKMPRGAVASEELWTIMLNPSNIVFLASMYFTGNKDL